MTKRLGVIQLIDSLNVGGAEVLAVNIANSLLEHNVDSHICATRKEGELYKNIKNKENYIFLKRKYIFDVKAILRLKKYIKKYNISIVHAHSTSVFMAIILKLFHSQISIIWHNHYGNNINLIGFKLLILKISSLTFNAIINVSEELNIWSQSKLFCSKTFYLKNFPFFINKEIKTILNGNKGKKIVHLASFREEKDHITLVKAFKDFVTKNIDWTLHLVGKKYENNYSKKIEVLIHQLDLQSHIFIYDSRPDIENILKQADIGVLSSKSEGLPLALLEYGLASLPVIVTDVGECANVVQHNKSGEVVAPQNVLLLSNSIKKLVNNTEKRTIFAKEFHKRIIENYSESIFIQELLKIYNI